MSRKKPKARPKRISGGRALIIKRKGHKEKFDERKVYASVYASCLNGHLSEQEAEKIASSVTDDVKKRVHGEREITSDKIFRYVILYLARHNKEIAFLYETHLDVS